MIIKLLKGLLLGLAANFIGTYLFILLFTDRTFEAGIAHAQQQGFLGGLIGIGAILNLLVFFYFLASRIGKFQKKIQYYEARGVLLATVIAALAVLYFEF